MRLPAEIDSKLLYDIKSRGYRGPGGPAPREDLGINLLLSGGSRLFFSGGKPPFPVPPHHHPTPFSLGPKAVGTFHQSDNSLMSSSQLSCFQRLVLDSGFTRAISLRLKRRLLAERKAKLILIKLVSFFKCDAVFQKGTP